MGTAEAEKNKKVFAKNFNYYLAINGNTQADIVDHFGITASTVSDWANGKKYPRVDKMQMLADCFGILKSDLTEEHIESQMALNTYSHWFPSAEEKAIEILNAV